MKKVVIVGAGALGSHVAQFLRNEAELKVIDFDRVEQKNVLAQFHARPAIGKNKAEALKQAMQFNWGLKIHAVPHKLTKDNASQLLGGTSATNDCQLIIDCLDNGEARRIIQQYVRYKDDNGQIQCGVDTLHGALAPGGDFGRVIWDEMFTIDDEAAGGAPTCEGGEFLPFIGIVAAYIARAAQLFLADGTKTGFVVHPGGVMKVGVR
ncbi:thiamine biosynthesis protein ThiF-like protein [Virus Rctr197k]|nr:thiamine biosynthesis protein ThiF-like protein [Virus Rctr197k]